MREPWVELTARILTGSASLPGAKCRHRYHLFDPAARNELPETTAARHARAVELCQTCPALDRCRQWFGSLRPKHRPVGVIAGIIVNQPRPRPRKDNT